MSNEKQYRIKTTEMKWNKDMDMRLKVLKEAETTIADMAKVFKCKELIIHRRLRVLNLTETIWTATQDTFLRKNYLMTSNKDMAHVLKVNEMYILDRLTYLGLARKRGPKVRAKAN